MDLLAKSGKPVIAVLNKTDLESPLLSEIRGLVQVNVTPKALINVSAVKGTNLEKLILAVMDECPEGELHYPTDFYTDQNPEFRISEIIREQAISRSEQEVPHALYVEIADMEFEEDRTSWKADADIPTDTVKPAELPPGAPAGFFEESTENKPVGGDSPLPEKRKKLWVRAFLVVERESQVGILVGHKGAKIKSIRIGALKEMKKVFDWKIRLDLRVKVNPKWRKKDPLLKRMLGQGQQK